MKTAKVCIHRQHHLCITCSYLETVGSNQSIIAYNSSFNRLTFISVTALSRSSIERHATFLHKNAPNPLVKLRNGLPKHERLISNVERPMEWIVKSGCHFSCMEHSSGIQVISSAKNRSMNIQLCQAQIDVCVKNHNSFVLNSIIQF